MDKKTKKIKNRLTCFSGLGSQITRHPSSQRFPQLSRPPRNHRHASRHHPRPPDRHRHPGDGSVLRRACGEKWAFCGSEVCHGTRWSPSTRRSSRGNSDKPNLPIKSKKTGALNNSPDQAVKYNTQQNRINETNQFKPYQETVWSRANFLDCRIDYYGDHISFFIT